MGLLKLYRLCTGLAAPLLERRERAKALERGVSTERVQERMGRATQARPNGPLIWLNAVSVGEANALRGLLHHLAQSPDAPALLVTTTTATAAQVITPHLPKGAIHQYLPLDTPAPVRRFLTHWQPDLAVFVESDLWPRLAVEAHRSGAKLALVNARISAKTQKNWAKFPSLVRAVLGHFDLVTTARADMGAVFAPYLACDVIYTADLKSSALLGAPNQTQAGSDRCQWLAASTHEGEEAIALKAHRQLRQTRPEALLIIAPRHPERFDAAAQAITASGLRAARRSLGETPQPEHAVYLADTLGEMALWYETCALTFLGGSTSDRGGHNPFEAARAGSYVISGPDVVNAQTSFDGLVAAGGAEVLDDVSSLGTRVSALLNSDALAIGGAAAKACCEAQIDGAAEIAPRLLALLGPRDA